MEKASQQSINEEIDLDKLINNESVKKTRLVTIYSILAIILVGTASFGLGRLSKVVGDREPTSVVLPAANSNPEVPTVLGASMTNSPATPSAKGNYVASKSGTKYHLPWCSSAQTIKEENKIWFQTKQEAEAAGYTPAANCKGI